MREVRVAMIGAGVISHRHMTIYENIQKNAEKLGFTAKVVAVGVSSTAFRRKICIWIFGAC